MRRDFLDNQEWSHMMIVELLQWVFHTNVSRVEPYQIADLEIGDGKVTIFIHTA